MWCWLSGWEPTDCVWPLHPAGMWGEAQEVVVQTRQKDDVERDVVWCLNDDTRWEGQKDGQKDDTIEGERDLSIQWNKVYPCPRWLPLSKHSRFMRVWHTLSVQNIKNTCSFHDTLTRWIQVKAMIPYWGQLLNPFQISVDEGEEMD